MDQYFRSTAVYKISRISDPTAGEQIKVENIDSSLVVAILSEEEFNKNYEPMD